MAGYSVECALKAVIAKQIGVRKYDYPDEADFARKRDDYWTHSFKNLIKTAQLNDDFNRELGTNATFAANWTVGEGWRETSRYETHIKQEAQDLINAIENPTEGVLQWLKRYWSNCHQKL